MVTLATLGAFAYTQAQERDTTCPVLIDQALKAIGTNCNSLDRNSACYGFQQVSATFTEPTQPTFFSEPSDRAQLETLKRIGTSAMDLALKKWGIALLSVQANLPDSLPGQNTLFMLLGDTEVENAVKPENQASTGTVIQVTTRSQAPMYPIAAVANAAEATIPAITLLPADALSPTGDWVHVVYEGQPGWVSRDTLAAQDTIDTLKILNPDAQKPMQSIYLRTSITGTHCTEAPDSLIVQGPKEIKVDINVNGADIRLGSTIALRIITLTPELADLFRPQYPNIDAVTQLLELVVIDGHVTLDAGTSREMNLAAGYRTYRCLTQPENLGLDEVTNDRQVVPPCSWLHPDQWRQVDYDTYSVLEGVSLNYPITMPEFPIPTLTPTATNTPTITPRPPTRTPVPFHPSPTPTFTPTCVPTEGSETDRLGADNCSPTPTEVVTEEPTTVTEEPTTVTEEPTTVTEEPTTVTEPPPIITEPPPVITEPPPVVTEPPPIITEPPSDPEPPPVVTDPPPVVTEPPIQ